MGITLMKEGTMKELCLLDRQGLVTRTNYRIGACGPVGTGLSKFHNAAGQNAPKAQMNQGANALQFALRAGSDYALCRIKKGAQEFGYFEFRTAEHCPVMALVQPGGVTVSQDDSIPLKQLSKDGLQVLSFVLYLVWVMNAENPNVLNMLSNGSGPAGACGDLQTTYRNCKNGKIPVTDRLLLTVSDCVQYGLGDYPLRISAADQDSFCTILAQTLRGASAAADPDGIPLQNKQILAKLARMGHKEPVEEETKGNTLFSMPLAMFMQKCRTGDFLVPYQWQEWQKGAIPPLSYLDSFVPTEEFRELLLSVHAQLMEKVEAMKKNLPYMETIGDNAVNIKVVGRPGSGKTVLIEAVIAALGLPKATVNCKERMEEDEIEGINKIVDGKITSIETDVCRIHTYGGAAVLEEVNLPDPGILQGTLGQALVFPYTLKKDGYIPVKRHPLTVYFATMNVGTNGTNGLNEAFSSRFSEGLELDMVSKEAFIQILAKKGNKKKDCQSVYDIFQAVLNCLSKTHEDIALAITMRHCIKALKLMEIGFPLKKAVEKTFLAEIAAVDGKAAERVRDAIRLML